MPHFLEHSTSSWKGQRLVHSASWIDIVDPRLRLISVSLFALIVVLTQDFNVLFLALLSSLLLTKLARLNIERTIRRLIAMDTFMIFLIVMLPFTTPGEVLFTLAEHPASLEGLLHALRIVIKANAVVLALLSLLGTMSATTLGHALAHLHVPDKLVHLLLFTVRYLDVISREYKRMRRAMQARAFILRSNIHTWRSIGYLVGMLLIHSLERAERITAAMKCRGYKGQFYLIDDHQLTRQDYSYIVCCTLLFAFLLGINFYDSIN